MFRKEGYQWPVTRPHSQDLNYHYLFLEHLCAHSLISVSDICALTLESHCLTFVHSLISASDICALTFLSPSHICAVIVMSLSHIFAPTLLSHSVICALTPESHFLTLCKHSFISVCHVCALTYLCLASIHSLSYLSLSHNQPSKFVYTPTLLICTEGRIYIWFVSHPGHRPSYWVRFLVVSSNLCWKLWTSALYYGRPLSFRIHSN